MSLIDDFLRLFGTSRNKLRWRWRSYKERQERRARAEENRGRSVAYGNKVCPKCRHPASKEDSVCSRCGTRLGSMAGQKLGRLFEGWIPAGVPAVSIGLLLVCVMIYIIGEKVGADLAEHSVELDAGQARVVAFWQLGANVPMFSLGQGEYWRFVTYSFIHVGGLLHLGMNAMAIIGAGRLLEERFGRARIIVCYVLGGICGGIVSAWWHQRQGVINATSGGASGIAFAQIGMMAAHALRTRDAWARTVRAQLVSLVIWNLIISFVPGIDGAAHAGGAVGGILCGLVMSDVHVARRRLDWLWRVLALAALAGVATAFVMASRWALPFDL